MLVLVDEDRAGAADESPGVGANRSSGSGIITVDHGASQTVGECMEKSAFAYRTGTVENERRLLCQSASQNRCELARSYAGERSIHS
jgi:hypothetical protein